MGTFFADVTGDGKADAVVVNNDKITVRRSTDHQDSGYLAIKDQLAHGFRDAGRSDLAQMVYTNDFYLWIQQESGWNPRAVSPPNNQRLSNDGLFQIWRGHSFNRHGEVSQMSPYQQARTVARYFPQLTPQKIHHYADQIRARKYKGWG